MADDLRQAESIGRPAGSADFLAKLEAATAPQAAGTKAGKPRREKLSAPAP